MRPNFRIRPALLTVALAVFAAWGVAPAPAVAQSIPSPE